MLQRADANQPALKVARLLLEAGEDQTLEVGGHQVEVQVERLPEPPWPQWVKELDPLRDGPWPRPVKVTCTPKDGSGSWEILVMAAQDKGRYRGDVALRVRLIDPRQSLVWINLRAPLQQWGDKECSIVASTSIVKRKGSVPDSYQAELNVAVNASGLPLVSPSRVEVCRVSFPGLEMTPTPSEAFRRLIHIALLKRPFLANAADAGGEWISQVEELDEDEGPEVDALMQEAIFLEEGEPARWNAERLDLLAAHVQPHLEQLELPPNVLEQTCAALSAGKHLLLVGPPGTGKTELAHALARAARSEGYCRGAFEATASADWTTYETIGGYALERDQSLHFREGAFLRAVAHQQWLLVDELNRADVDKAFGELMTVLSGKGTDTPFELDDRRRVSIGFDAGRSHRVSRTFRVIATLNTWDKTSLFRLSYAVQRRFAVIHIGIPTDETYARLISRAALTSDPEPALDEATVRLLTRLFQRQTLLGSRDIGPAIALDIVRYMRRRAAGGIGLAEALAMFLLPQLEGLDAQSARKVYALFVSTLSGWTPDEAMLGLRARCEELWPPGSLPDA